MLNYEQDQLAYAIQSGDHTAFTFFYEQQFRKIKLQIWFLTKSEDLADEITQQAFTKLWANRAQLQAGQSLTAYIRSIAQNLTIDEIRKTKTKEKYQQQLSRPEAFEQPDRLEYNQLCVTVNLAIASLPAEKREIFKLSREEEMSYKEIAAKLNTTPKAVERQMARTLSIIKSFLKKTLDYPFISLLIFFLLK